MKDFVACALAFVSLGYVSGYFLGYREGLQARKKPRRLSVKI